MCALVNTSTSWSICPAVACFALHASAAFRLAASAPACSTHARAPPSPRRDLVDLPLLSCRTVASG
ncbi:BQ5605_C014g07448 [Microbotryum silenes-dioicae]|uniref:BQ5605_C011g06500 protein n=1 Tax=Microbotryum silenes-dioicae TaxID=796604 RepID=A0A2X0LTP4_9BASI|nr:BQ5605_C011g06500 [Microbotryum silenes-dioicae]SGY18703.1 BQ5605_C014g07448 [Microbotryum silenes-dioicae]